MQIAGRSWDVKNHISVTVLPRLKLRGQNMNGYDGVMVWPCTCFIIVGKTTELQMFFFQLLYRLISPIFLAASLNFGTAACPEQSGDSWMYPYHRTPIGNPYLSLLYSGYMCYNPQEFLENTIAKYHGHTVTAKNPSLSLETNTESRSLQPWNPWQYPKLFQPSNSSCCSFSSSFKTRHVSMKLPSIS